MADNGRMTGIERMIDTGWITDFGQMIDSDGPVLTPDKLRSKVLQTGQSQIMVGKFPFLGPLGILTTNYFNLPPNNWQRYIAP